MDAVDQDIIGLKVSDRTFYTFRSTLTGHAGSTLAARFGNATNDLSPGGFIRRDQDGIPIYFIDRDGDLFQQVLAYLRTGKLNLPTFHKNPELWRDLREEAVYFGLDALSSLLHATYSCSPEAGDKGLLYWLGTNRGTSDDYVNPYESGVVRIHEYQKGQACDYYPEYMPSAFVQYHPKPWTGDCGDYMDAPYWGIYAHECPRTILLDLGDVQLQPSHYSIRSAQNASEGGMTVPWTFEASNDKQNWDTLHEAGEDCFIPAPRTEESVVRFLETKYRRTWPVNDPTSAFYRYFRIHVSGVSVTDIGSEPAGYWTGCGLELFGNVHEN